MPSPNATPKDVALLTSAGAPVDAAGAYLGQLAPQLDDQGAADHVARLSLYLQEEAMHLRSMARAKLEYLQEQWDKEDGESAPVDHDWLYAVYDQRAVTDRGADNVKWYNPFTDENDSSGSTRNTYKRGICFHHTAVAGGFGTHGSRRDYWEKQIDSGLWTPKVPQPNGKMVQTEWIDQPRGAAWEELSAAERDQAWVRAMALGDRYRGYKPQQYNTGVPYHVVSGANSVLYLNLPFRWVTWHGNGANNWYLGFAWDANSNDDNLHEEDMEADVRRVIEIGRGEGHFADGLEFTMHCAFTNKPTDAGRKFAEFLVDLADKVGATIRMDYKAKDSYSSFNDVLAA